MKQGIDYIGIGVGAMIFNARGEVFLAQRGPKAKNERGHWEFPGGSVDYGETMAVSLQREMQEEYGIGITLERQLGTFDHILPDEQQHWVSTTYIAQHASGTPEILEPHKCSAIGWFALDALPTPLSKITRLNLAAWQTAS